MNCFETMTCDSEQIVNQAMDREKSLDLCCRFEATHLPFLFSGVLVRDLNPIGSPMETRLGGLQDNSLFVGHECERWLPLVLQDPVKKALGGARHRGVSQPRAPIIGRPISYSCLSASIGCTEARRIAGRKHASAAAMKAAGSIGAQVEQQALNEAARRQRGRAVLKKSATLHPRIVPSEEGFTLER